MPKKSRKSAKNRALANGDIIVSESGLAYVSGTTDASGNLFIQMTPGAPGAAYFGYYSTKLAQLGDCFSFYRFTKLKVVVPSLGSGSGLNALGYSAAIPGTAPTTTLSTLEMPWSWLIRDGSNTAITTVTQTKVIPRRELSEVMTKWFRTYPTSYDDNVEYQGYLNLRGFNSASVILTIHWEAEFCQFTAPNQLPFRAGEDEEEKTSTVLVTHPQDKSDVVSVKSLSGREHLFGDRRLLRAKGP